MVSVPYYAIIMHLFFDLLGDLTPFPPEFHHPNRIPGLEPTEDCPSLLQCMAKCHRVEAPNCCWRLLRGLTLAIRIQNIHQYSNDSYQSSLAFASTKGWPVYLVSRIVVLYHHYPYQKCHSGGIPWCTQFSDTSVVVFDRTWAHLLPRTSVLSTC